MGLCKIPVVSVSVRRRVWQAKCPVAWQFAPRDGSSRSLKSGSIVALLQHATSQGTDSYILRGAILLAVNAEVPDRQTVTHAEPTIGDRESGAPSITRITFIPLPGFFDGMMTYETSTHAVVLIPAKDQKPFLQHNPHHVMKILG